MTWRSTLLRTWRNIALALVVLIGLAGLQPFIWRNVQLSAQQLQDRRTKAEQLSTLERQLEEVRSELVQHQPLVDQTSISFPYEEAAPQIIERLEQLAEQRGLRATVTSIQRKEDRSGMIVMKVAVSVTGSVATLLEYLDRLEHAQEFAIVEGWGIQPFSPPDLGPIGNTYQMTFNADFYLQKDPNAKQ